LRQLAELCEFCVLDPERAAELYSASYQANRSQLDVLSRLRRLCHSMGRTDHAARTAELENRHSNVAGFHAIAGQAWLDAGNPDRALGPLLRAKADAPDDPSVRAALEVARREWIDPVKHAEELLNRAQVLNAETPNDALQAARILRMLDIEDERYEKSLRLCLATNPNLPSACHLMEHYLFSAGRLGELAEHFQRRSNAAPNKDRAAQILFQGSSLLFRADAGADGGPLFVAGLELAVKTQLTSIPGLLAQLRGLIASSAGERKQVVELADQAYRLLKSPDEQVGIAIFCAQIAWQAQKDREKAQTWLNRLTEHCKDHPLHSNFDML
jgi:tetratricopeptide (TPR) repeat protein